MQDFFEIILNVFNIFDYYFCNNFLYTIIQCYVKGFSLSFISFMKWVFALNSNDNFSSKITTLGK